MATSYRDQAGQPKHKLGDHGIDVFKRDAKGWFFYEDVGFFRKKRQWYFESGKWRQSIDEATYQRILAAQQEEPISVMEDRPTICQLDVMTESYVPTFLRLVDKEIMTIKESIAGQKQAFRDSVTRIVDDYRQNRTNRQSWREVVEFSSG